MKRLIILAAFLSVFTFNTNAQESREKELIYRIGVGPWIEGNAGLWTINLMNELSYYAMPRFSINPKACILSFFNC